MSIALNNGLSGMLANQRAVDISAHNTANASTNGFQPSRAKFSEQAKGGVEVSPSPSTKVSLSTPAGSAGSASGGTSATTASGTDYATEAVNSLTYKLGFDMSAKVVKTSDQMLGTLVNIKA